MRKYRILFLIACAVVLFGMSSRTRIADWEVFLTSQSDQRLDSWIDGPFTATKTECVTLENTGITCHATGGCTKADVAGDNFDYPVAAFTDADGLGTWTFNNGLNVAGTTAAVRIFWTANDVACNNGSDDDVCWTLNAGSAGNSELWQTMTLGGTMVAVTDKCHTNGDIHIATFPAFTHDISPGERVAIQLGRDADGTDAECVTGNDDFTGDAKLLAVEFCFEVDNIFSGE